MEDFINSCLGFGENLKQGLNKMSYSTLFLRASHKTLEFRRQFLKEEREAGRKERDRKEGRKGERWMRISE